VIVQHEDAVAEIAIPGWVIDLPSYRRWAHSDEYPQRGWVSFLDGEIWVELSMEELITHNRVKTAYTYCIVDALRRDPRGDFVSDRMLLTNPTANLSTEPDGLFYLWDTIRAGKLRFVPGKTSGYMELEGTPDMTLEIVSKTSQRKDKNLLRELYWKAGVTEYWLVDALHDPAQFDVLLHTPTGYVPTPSDDGWLTSKVLGRDFRLVRGIDPLGHPQFVVEVR
jgi:Uma2 family endonuclease